MREPTTFLRDRELAFVTGKGGVGRTTVALAFALAAARAGRRAVLCELAGQAGAPGAGGAGATVLCELPGQARAPRLYGLDTVRAGREAPLEERLWATTIDPV